MSFEIVDIFEEKEKSKFPYVGKLKDTFKQAIHEELLVLFVADDVNHGEVRGVVISTVGERIETSYTEGVFYNGFAEDQFKKVEAEMRFE